MNHIPILHHIFLTFGAHFARFFGFGFAAERYKIIISNHLRADKAAFEIGVDHAGGLRGGVAFVDGPGADFFYAGGEISLQAEQVVAGADQAV